MKPELKSCPFFRKWAVGLATVLLMGAWAAAQETKSEEAPVPMSLAHAKAGLATGCHASPHQGHQEDCLSCHTFENWWVGNSATKDMR